ncbi:unnamed protein product [Trifolium pratense]|uniref:Uncharacterized protein n=1 Tax=Trifolium pratense TaxID=57577 RepID=A0ACB0K435_TRIPR|nr:unnamed protein product [Trifolium pratense]
MTNFDVSSSSSSSLMLSPKKYDVFLSFRGEDTRDNITSHLHEALKNKNVETYIDNRLEKGEGIGPSLMTAIEESHVSVIIFSINYASSKWCLDEIVKIIECKKERGQIVIPVFYKIDPSHVRNQRGTYENLFAEHLKTKNSYKVFNWRSALTEAANLAGWDFQTYRSESQFIKDIVKDILQRLNLIHPIELKGVVGIEENYEGVKSLLEMDSQDVRVIGIWGMGGIGKTTLAIALRAKLSSQFEGHCFLANVREQIEKNNIDFLRNKLFSELLEEENLHVNVPKVEYHCVTNRLRRKKVLIVLDDVATSEQLDDLISDCDFLGPGSRVIVTTRDKHIINHVDEIYEVKELNKDNSLRLFYSSAFKEKHLKSGYEELSKSVIAYCKGNPLALKILGVRLRSRSKEAWESELKKLKKIPNMKIQNVLKLSYDELDSDQQNIFLDIACFVKEESRDRVTNLLEACDFHPVIGIEDLVEKSLVTISNKGTIQMHDLIQEMGWNIVHQESPKDPGSRTRLWDPNEVYDVLKYNKGTKTIEGITLDMSKVEDLHLKSNSFTKMSEMRFLKFYYGKCNGTSNIYLPENGLDSLSDKLRYLEWHRYCLKSLPSKFSANLLVELSMPYSNLQKLWDGVQNLANLKEIDLRFSNELVEVPDLSKATNLEWLALTGCRNLCEIHPSILSLDKLKDLELEGCTKIESFHTDNHLDSLQTIQLSNCSSLKEFSVTSNKLEKLWLDGTSIKELPSSILCCQKLKMIDLHNCDNLVGFGENENYIEIGSLSTLVLSGCKKLNASNLCFNFKPWQSTLTSLNLENCCNLEALPDSIGLLSSLQCLKLSGSNVKSLSPNIKNLNNLKELRLDNCKKLVSMSVSELPPSLRLFSAINCISLVSDLTTLDIPFEHRTKPQPYYQSVIFPGGHVPKRFSFHSEENHHHGSTSSVTIRHLPEHGLYGLVFCIVLSESIDQYRYAQCSIYQNSKRIGVKSASLLNLVMHLVTDHVFLWYLDVGSGAKNISLHSQIQESGAWDNPCNISFEFSLENEEGEWSTERIKGCGVFPLYHLEESNNFEEMNELHVTTIGCDHKNEENETKELHQTIVTHIQDENLDSNKTSSSHIFVVPTANGSKTKPQSLEEYDFYTNTSSIPQNQFDTARASNIMNPNQTIEMVSKEKDLTNPQLEQDSWDPISELESLLCDSYDLSPMCTDSTTVSVLEDPNVATIIENLETLLETPLEIFSSDNEVKQKFLKILEQLGQFESQIPIRLHHVICKLRTFIEGVDVRFVNAQKTIQDYDQLLQSRSLISKKLESAKAREKRNNCEISRGNIQFEKINSEIVELEQKLSGLVEIRDKLKRDLEQREVINNKIKTEVAQDWVPQCKIVLTNLKKYETSYKVALTNKKKLEDEWIDLKKNFATNKI